jgi:hypothetical protein
MLTLYLGFRPAAALPPTVGLCDFGEFEILPPGTAAQLKNL